MTFKYGLFSSFKYPFTFQMSISQMLLSFPPHFPFSFRTSTEPGRVMHWHHWSWVLVQTPKLAYPPLTYYSPTSPSTTLTWLLLRCSLWALLPRNVLFPFIFKTTTTKALFLAVSFCSRGWRMLSHIASSTAVCCNSVFCLEVRSGILQRSSRGWQCPCTAPGAAYSWHQLDPAACTERLLLSCCA